MKSNRNNKNVINKKYIKANWYAWIIEFLNKADIMRLQICEVSSKMIFYNEIIEEKKVKL
ncbi:MAG: hypothetical protein OHM56_03100 [Spiroplasma phoeniceum]|nr:MAG: hypothetical protein OHM57_02550 [Spiroplasma phoeniceum]UZQ32953.1 MAG: hypothetical protein OHM56_03100 [Spiroplasma phoeniceum]